MTRDDIIRMAQEAGWHFLSYEFSKVLMRYTDLVVAAEREACAQVCDKRAVTAPIGSDEQCEAEDCAFAIRRRGEA